MKRTALTALLLLFCLTACGEAPDTTPAQTSSSAEQSERAEDASGSNQSDKLAEQVELLRVAADEAEQKMRDADAENESAKKAYASAQEALDTFLAENEESIPFCGNGALGFFMYSGAEGAVNALTESAYASFTDPKSDADAVSYENVKKTFELLRECNRLRETADPPLPPLMITDQLMAVAEANLNWSDTTLEHSAQFSYDENLAWTEADPFTQWLDTTSTGYDGSAYNNIYSPDHTQTGFAVCTKNGMGDYPTTFCQVFSGAVNSPAYTVDEYEAKFNAFTEQIGEINSRLKELQTAADSTKAVLEKKAAALEDALNAYNDATEAYQQAVSVYNWYT